MAKEKKQKLALVPQGASKDYDLKGFVRRTAPPVIKPGTLAVGVVIVGKVLAIVERDVKEAKGKSKKTQLLHLQAPDGTEVLFPCGTVVRSALTRDGEKLSDVVGKIFACRVLEPRQSPTWKRDYFNAEIFTRDAKG